jgi:hypothetical protein
MIECEGTVDDDSFELTKGRFNQSYASGLNSLYAIAGLGSIRLALKLFVKTEVPRAIELLQLEMVAGSCRTAQPDE